MTDRGSDLKIIIDGKTYYVVDDSFHIPTEIMAMSLEEIQAKIKEIKEEIKKEENIA